MKERLEEQSRSDLREDQLQRHFMAHLKKRLAEEMRRRRRRTSDMPMSAWYYNQVIEGAATGSSLYERAFRVFQEDVRSGEILLEAKPRPRTAKTKPPLDSLASYMSFIGGYPTPVETRRKFPADPSLKMASPSSPDDTFEIVSWRRLTLAGRPAIARFENQDGGSFWRPGVTIQMKKAKVEGDRHDAQRQLWNALVAELGPWAGRLTWKGNLRWSETFFTHRRCHGAMTMEIGEFAELEITLSPRAFCPPAKEAVMRRHRG